MAGYVRQSVADIVNGLNITAPPINAELNALAAAFGATGHVHDGSIGNGPKIPLGTSVTGYLPAANGGNGGKNKIDAVVAPATNNDTLQGYKTGSVWIDTTAKKVYLCMDPASGAAVWSEVARLDASGVFVLGATGTADLGSSSKRWKSLYLSSNLDMQGNATIGGTLSTTGLLTAIGGVSGNVTGNVTGDLTGNVNAATGSSVFNNVTVNGTADFTNTQLKNVSSPIAANDAANKSYVDAAVAALLDSAPGTLDTLNELAAALGDDPNFATTVSNDIATKVSKAGDTMTGDLAMSGNKVTGLADPTTGSDAVTKSFMEALFGTTATAEESALTAEAWAEKPEDTEVEPGSYSALHHAAKALQSAAAAAASASTAEGYLDEFGDLYLGQQASNPTVDNDGNTLQTGSLFWHVTEEAMKVWTGSVWRVINVTSTFPNVNNPVNATDVEMNRLVGVTDDIQTQIDGKLAVGAKAADSELLDGLDSSQFLRSDQSGSVTGTLTVTGDVSSDADIHAVGSVYAKSATPDANVHYWLQNSDGKNEGLLYWEGATDLLRLRRYATTGTGIETQVTLGPLGVGISAAGNTPTEMLDVVGKIASDSYVIAGKGGGGVALTINDTQGNANVTFNHVDGTPEQSGNSGRIGVNTDAVGGAWMTFELASNVTGGVNVSTSQVFWVSESAFTVNVGSMTVGGNEVWHAGNDGPGSGLNADLLDGLQPNSENVNTTIVERNGAGDIKCRLVRQEFQSASSIANGADIIMRNDNAGDDYLRPVDKTGFRAWVKNNGTFGLCDEDANITNVTASRGVNTGYHNNRNRPIAVNVRGRNGIIMRIAPQNSNYNPTSECAAGTQPTGMFAIVPPGWWYKFDGANTSDLLNVYEIT